MNRFENVCGPCPLRTKVDLRRAREVQSWGSGSVQSTLSDGKNRHSLSLARGEVEDSDTAQAIDLGIQNRIQECKGPEIGVFRASCGAELADAWRWTKERGQMQPNVADPSEIVPLLADATREDAEPHYDHSTWVVGDFSEYDTGHDSSFHNRTIKKLSKKVRGTTAELPKGKAVILDSASRIDHEGLYRIRVPQGGPHFAFSIEPSEERQEVDLKTVLAEGIYRFLHATPEELDASNALLTKVDREDTKREEERNSNIHNYLTSGQFSKDMDNAYKKLYPRQADDQ